MAQEIGPNVPADGVHLGIPMPGYVAMPLPSSGTPGKLRRGTLEGVKKSIYGGDSGGGGSAAQKLGNVVHAAVLEPDSFESMFMPLPFADPEKYRTGGGAISKTPKATKDYRVAVEAQRAEFPDHEHVEETEYRKGLAMRDNVFTDPEVKTLLQAPGLIEATIVVTDPWFGLRWKFRPDKHIAQIAAILSVKTCQNAREDVFTHDFFKFQYHMKEWLYAALLPVAGLEVRNPWMLAIESTGTHDFQLFAINEAYLDMGEQLVMKYARVIAEAFDRDEWPGLPAGLIDLAPPDYAYAKVDDELASI